MRERKINILLIENNPAHADIIRRSMVDDKRFQLIMAEQLSQATKILKDWQPDLILANYSLPDGYATELLPGNVDSLNCPVVIMALQGEEAMAVKAMKSGAWDYIIKTEAALLDIPHLILRVARDWVHLLEKQKATDMQQRLMGILEATPDFVAIFDADGFAQYLNSAGRKMLGITPDETLSNQRITDFYSIENAKLIRGEAILSAIKKGQWSGETELVTHNKNVIPVSQVLISHPCKSGGTGYFSTIIRDISENKKVLEKIEYLAYHDSLTGLINRTQLHNELSREIARAHRHDETGAILFIDLDHFKKINDSLGHLVGDSVLLQIALALKANVRRDDIVARLGGDEFIIILSGLDKDQINAAEKAKEIAEKSREDIAKIIYAQNHQMQVTASIGIALFPELEGGTYELIQHADTAMYHAKAQGRNAIAFFHSGMGDAVSRQLKLEVSLRRAVEEQQFELYFQPQYSIPSNEISGAEVLLRWQHPELGIVPPFEFISVLESSGLISEVGLWVFENACRQLAKWLAKGIWQPEFHLGINISPRQFRDAGFVAGIQDILALTQVPAHYLEIEITENIVIYDLDKAIEIMQQLNALGIRFAIDDFGTGYSSLRYIKRLPVSVLKIDRSFIMDMCNAKDDASIVDTIIAMAKHLQLDVVAEGVETAQQLQLLKKLQCGYFQGYLSSQPLPAKDFEALFDTG